MPPACSSVFPSVDISLHNQGYPQAFAGDKKKIDIVTCNVKNINIIINFIKSHAGLRQTM